MKVTLASSGFVPPKQAAYLDGANLGIAPDSFQWEWSDPQTARFVTEERIGAARGRGQVAWLLEPFFLHPVPYLSAMDKPFDYVLTHDRNFSTNLRNWLYFPAGGSWIGLNDWGIREKHYNISMLLSAKKMTEGHRLRHEILAKHGGCIDAVFGLDHRVTPLEALADFRYSIIIENEKTAGWFTEKLIDCLSVGTVPIYWGDPDIGKIFEAAGLIEFADMSDLDAILDWLLVRTSPIDDYARRLPAVGRNLETAKKYRICEDWIFEHYPFLFGATA